MHEQTSRLNFSFALDTEQHPGRVGWRSLDVPVAIGAVTFEPGAHLVSDSDGIVVLSQESTRSKST